jgi:hypothetical protein
VHVERLNGALRDRLTALTRKTHAETLRDATWDALVGLQLFDHNSIEPIGPCGCPWPMVVCVGITTALRRWLWG